MRRYEVVYVFSDSKQSVPDMCAIVRKDLESLKIHIKQEEDMGKRKLAYPIRKQTEGHYYLFSVEMDPQTVTTLNTYYKHNEDVLRHLIVRIS